MVYWINLTGLVNQRFRSDPQLFSLLDETLSKLWPSLHTTIAVEILNTKLFTHTSYELLISSQPGNFIIIVDTSCQ